VAGPAIDTGIAPVNSGDTEADYSVRAGALIGRGARAEVYGCGEGRVLKLFLSHAAPGSARIEAEIVSAVVAAGIPAPPVVDLIEVDGRPGIVFERVRGPSMLEALNARPWRAWPLARALAELHASVHRAAAAPVLPSQREQLRRNITRADSVPRAHREAALRALERLPDGDRLCHGDFHPDNVVLSERGAVILDWSNAGRGNPLADAARTALLLRAGVAPQQQQVARHGPFGLGRRLFARAYLRAYLNGVHAPAAQLVEWRLPVAVARLGEQSVNLVAERPRLLRLVAAGVTAQERSR
jgi:aminoglycoside phosphotransferase (APT) family kinase protein